MSYRYYIGTVLTAEEGIQQGDPIGPIFFSLAIQEQTEPCQSDLSL